MNHIYTCPDHVTAIAHCTNTSGDVVALVVVMLVLWLCLVLSVISR